MADYTGKKTDKLCKECKQGWLHQYPQDSHGTLRCGRCGELETKAAPATTRKAAAK